MVDIEHSECEEFVSICCGKGKHEYAETFCGYCNEGTNFECIECGVFIDDLPVRVLKAEEWKEFEDRIRGDQNDNR